MQNKCRLWLGLGLMAVFVGTDPVAADNRVVVVGGSLEDVQAAKGMFEARLGGLDNGGAPGPLRSGFRVINWDGVPETVVDPNFFPGDFFNATQAPRARGALLTVAGQSTTAAEDLFMVSAGSGTGIPVNFGSFNSTYSFLFKPFSPERLFAYTVPTNDTFDVVFFVPGQPTTPALVSGFASVFAGVNQANVTKMEYFDGENASLGMFAVPPSDEFSFLGVDFSEGPVISRVRITVGSQPISLGLPDGSQGDVVVMDDFIYGEPQPLQGPDLPPQVVQVFGTQDAIAEAKGRFEAQLGGSNNGGDPGPFADGFRVVNWDGVPQTVVDPNFLPGDFFNGTEAPRARGILFTTSGQSTASNNPELFLVSTAAGETAPLNFGRLNPSYTEQFTAFSPERLFAYTNPTNNTFDVVFFAPGDPTQRALVSGFGSVFTGVGVANVSKMEYFDGNNLSLGTYPVPAGLGSGTMSFLGVSFPQGSVVSRVRVTVGDQPIALGLDDGARGDVVVMDDFVYGEPQTP